MVARPYPMERTISILNSYFPCIICAFLVALYEKKQDKSSIISSNHSHPTRSHLNKHHLLQWVLPLLFVSDKPLTQNRYWSYFFYCSLGRVHPSNCTYIFSLFNHIYQHQLPYSGESVDKSPSVIQLFCILVDMKQWFQAHVHLQY